MSPNEPGGLKLPLERALFLIALAFFAWQASGAVRGWPSLEPLGDPGRSNLRFERPQGEAWLSEVPFETLWNSGRRNAFIAAGFIEDPERGPRPPFDPRTPRTGPRPPAPVGALAWPGRAPMPPDKHAAPPTAPPPVAPPVVSDRPAVTVAGVVRMEGRDDRYSVILSGASVPTRRFQEGDLVNGSGIRILSVDHGRVLVEDSQGRRFEARDVLWSEWSKIAAP